MTALETPADVLERAAQILDETGWCQCDFENERGEHCAAMALSKAVQPSLQPGGTFSPLYLAAREALIAYLCARATDGFRSITYWNDAPGRTKEEVQQAFRDAAETLRAKG